MLQNNNIVHKSAFSLPFFEENFFCNISEVLNSYCDNIGGKRKGEKLHHAKKRRKKTNTLLNHLNLVGKLAEEKNSAEANLFLSHLMKFPASFDYYPIFNRALLVREFFFTEIQEYIYNLEEIDDYWEAGTLKDELEKMIPKLESRGINTESVSYLAELLELYSDILIEITTSSEKEKNTVISAYKKIIPKKFHDTLEFNYITRILPTNAILTAIFDICVKEEFYVIKQCLSIIAPEMIKNTKFQSKIIFYDSYIEKCNVVDIPNISLGIDFLGSIDTFFRSYQELPVNLMTNIITDEFMGELKKKPAVFNYMGYDIATLPVYCILYISLYNTRFSREIKELGTEHENTIQNSFNKFLLIDKEQRFMKMDIGYDPIFILFKPGTLPMFGYYALNNNPYYIYKFAERFSESNFVNNLYDAMLKGELPKKFDLSGMKDVEKSKKEFLKYVKLWRNKPENAKLKRRVESYLMKFIYYIITNKNEEFFLFLSEKSIKGYVYYEVVEESIINNIHDINFFLELAGITDKEINQNHKMFLKEYKYSPFKINDLITVGMYHKYRPVKNVEIDEDKEKKKEKEKEPPTRRRIDNFTALKWLLYQVVRI